MSAYMLDLIDAARAWRNLQKQTRACLRDYLIDDTRFAYRCVDRNHVDAWCAANRMALFVFDQIVGLDEIGVGNAGDLWLEVVAKAWRCAPSGARDDLIEYLVSDADEMESDRSMSRFVTAYRRGAALLQAASRKPARRRKAA